VQWLRPIPNLVTRPSSHGAREPVSVVLPFDNSRKKKGNGAKGNVSHGKAKMDKIVRRRELPFVHCQVSLYSVMPMEKGKGDQEAKKKRRKGH
jgi:hypothetical protein